ncbi:hypothetical protein C5167_028555 [Papaver somniferum]|nr:hypothetical protein C5167_028555 [Papaver somniferum]
METIHLPSLRNWMELDGFDIQDCVLSSPPRGSRNDGESMVFFLFTEAGPGNFDSIKKTLKCKKDEEDSCSEAEESKTNVKNEVDDPRQRSAWANGNRLSYNMNIRTALSPWMVFSDDNLAAYVFLNPLHTEKYLMNIPELFKEQLSNSQTYQTTRNFCTQSSLSLPGDESWTINILDNVPPNRKDVSFKLSLNNPVFYRGAFYCLDCNGTLGVYDLNGFSWEILVKVPPPSCSFIYKRFLVECGGELLSVYLGNFGEWVRAFRLDMPEKVWMEVKHLGKHMLFISNASCVSAVAPNCRMDNKIYFPRLHNRELLCYSLETGTYNSLSSGSSAADFYESTEYLSCSWIEPDWSETTIQDLDWLSS